MEISIIGLGFVGGAMAKSFILKGCKVKAYDKYKTSDSFEDCLKSDIIFLALPTTFSLKQKKYDLSPIYETCQKLESYNYNGIVVIKSTVEPLTTKNLYKKYKLNFVHNPEFLTASTAFTDFHNQKHIVLGKQSPNQNINILLDFYKKYYSTAEISVCSSTESESMKSFVNCFYSTKIQFFNELFMLCNTIDCDYNNVKNLMLKNKWINPMHTNVPGPDGKLSYGGFCFPKDTNALLEFMKNNNTPCEVLSAVINERNQMRDDNKNIIISNKNNEKKKEL